MKVMYDTTVIDSVTYITGYWSSSDPNAVDLDPQLESVMSWYDDNGNPMWVLNGDGTIVNQPIVVTQTTKTTQTVSTATADLNTVIQGIINCLVNGESITADLVSQWNTVYRT